MEVREDGGNMQKLFTVCYSFSGAMDVWAENEDEAKELVMDEPESELIANAEGSCTAVIERDENGNLVYEHIL